MRWKRLGLGTRDEERLFRILVKCHPLGSRHGTRAKTAPMHLLIADAQPANMLKKKERYWAFQPVLQILLDFTLAVLNANANLNFRAAFVGTCLSKPLRLSEPAAIDGTTQRRVVELDCVTKDTR